MWGREREAGLATEAAALVFVSTDGDHQGADSRKDKTVGELVFFVVVDIESNNQEHEATTRCADPGGTEHAREEGSFAPDPGEDKSDKERPPAEQGKGHECHAESLS